MPLKKSELLDLAVEFLDRGEPLALDAVARASGLTKPGVIHHVGSKEGLMVSVVDRVIYRWALALEAQLPENHTETDRLLADGAWFNSSMGIPTMGPNDRSEVRRIARLLITGCEIE